MRALALLMMFVSLACAKSTPLVDRISAASIQKDIAYLASDDFNGREARSLDAKLVAFYIAERFRAAGLEPVAGGAGFFHAVKDAAMAPNVMGIRRGRGEDIVLVTAHYDHLGIDKHAAEGADRIFNGADDNASGVAAVLAVADALHAAKAKLDASVIFIAFTGEEEGLRGARFVAGQPPFSLARVRGMFNMDMISRGEEDLIYVDGGKEADVLRETLRSINETKQIGLRIKFDEHPDWIMRSDQGPFVRRKVPAVLFSVEDHPDYHQVTDHADKILPKLAERVTKLVLLATAETANRPTTQPATQAVK